MITFTGTYSLSSREITSSKIQTREPIRRRQSLRFIGDEPTSFSMTRFAKPKSNGPVLTGPILDKPTMDKIVHMPRHIEHVWMPGSAFWRRPCKWRGTISR